MALEFSDTAMSHSSQPDDTRMQSLPTCTLPDGPPERIQATIPTKPFPILDLPRELRDRILSYICGKQIIKIFFDRDDSKLRSKPFPGQPYIRCIVDSAKNDTMSILLLSRQIGAEAARVVYTTSIFCFHKPETFLFFIATIPTKYLSLIFMVYMRFQVRYPREHSEWEEFLTRRDSLSQLKTLKNLFLKLTVRPLPTPDGPFWFESSPQERQKQEILRHSETLRMLKRATLRVEIQRRDRCDPSEHVLRHMKEIRDLVEGHNP